MKKSECKCLKITEGNLFKGIIYVLTNIVTGKQYVGQTTQDVAVRIKWHVTDSRRKKKHKFLIHEALEQYGVDNFGFDILCDFFETTEDARNQRLNGLEKFCIKELNTKIPYGYNSTDGGKGTNGFRHREESITIRVEKFKGRFAGINNPMYGKCLSEEQREKVSQGRKGKCKGEKNHNYGKPLPLEVRVKISEKLKVLHQGENNPFYNRTHTEQAKKLISEKKRGQVSGFYGKSHTDDTKRKISKNRKGKNTGIDHHFFQMHLTEEAKSRLRQRNKKRIPVLMFDAESGVTLRTFDSLRHASNWIRENTLCLGDKSVIRRALDSRTGMAYGFIWKRLERKIV